MGDQRERDEWLEYSIRFPTFILSLPNSSTPFSGRVFGFQRQNAGITSNSIFNFDSEFPYSFADLSRFLRKSLFFIDTWWDDGRGRDIHLLL